MSTLKADTIVATDGTSPVTLTKQSAAKAWANLNGAGTIALRDSFNCSSAADNGTGDYDYNWTNNFNNENYAFSGQAAYMNGSNASVLIWGQKNESAYTTSINTSDINVQSTNQNMGAFDAGSTTISVNGDLA